MDRDDGSRSMPGGSSPTEGGAFDVTEMSADDIAAKIARRMELWRSTQVESGRRRAAPEDAGPDHLYGQDFATLLADRPSFAPATLQDLARRSWKFAGLTVIRRRVAARAGIGARFARNVRMAVRRAGHAAQATLVLPIAGCLARLAAGVRAAFIALWRNVCLLPGDLRSAGGDLVAGAAALLQYIKAGVGRSLSSYPRAYPRAMAAAGILLILLGAGALLLLDQMPMRQLARVEAQHAPRSSVSRLAADLAPDPALASSRRRDLDRAAAARAPQNPGAAKHPPTLIPWLKPTTRAAAVPQPDRRPAEQVVLTVTATMAPAMLISAPRTPIPAARAEEPAEDSAGPQEDPAREHATADEGQDDWMLNWIYSDGIQPRLP